LTFTDGCGSLRKPKTADVTDDSLTAGLQRTFSAMPEKLKERGVKNLPAPKAGAVTTWDDEVRGFGVRVFAPTTRHPEGARSFFFNYRWGGKERRYTIGSYPMWSVDAARAEAKLLRKRIDRGEDPAAAKREQREAPTMRDLIARYRTEHMPSKFPGYPNLTGIPKMRAKDEDRMLDEAGEGLGWDRKVADVHFGDVQKLHRDITESGRPVRANRVLAAISKMFSLSLRPEAGEDLPWRNQALGNPCKGVARNPEEGKERFLSDAELAAVSDALNDYGKDARGPGLASAKAAADAIRFIVLTGARPAEAREARWEELDAEPGFWVKPSAHTKQRKVHKAALSPAALELIGRLRAERERGKQKGVWVFPGQKKGEPLKQLRSCWQWVRERATVALWASGDGDVAALVNSLRADLGRDPSISECKAAAAQTATELPAFLLDTRIYDLRHTFASVGAGGGVGLHLIGRLLGHTQSRTTQRYAHLADDAVVAAANKIGTAISNAGKKNKPAAIPLAREA